MEETNLTISIDDGIVLNVKQIGTAYSYLKEGVTYPIITLDECTLHHEESEAEDFMRTYIKCKCAYLQVCDGAASIVDTSGNQYIIACSPTSTTICREVYRLDLGLDLDPDSYERVGEDKTEEMIDKYLSIDLDKSELAADIMRAGISACFDLFMTQDNSMIHDRMKKVLKM